MDKKYILLYLFILLFYNIICLMQKNTISKLTQKIENLENHNDTLSSLYDNIRAFKHDFNNIVYTIGGFISNNDMENLKKYYNNLSTDCQRVNNIGVLDQKVINNSGVYNLLNIKLKKAKELNIKFNIECFLDFNKLNMPIYEFTRILGIFIDNAIEAANNSQEKIINIVFRDSSQNNTQLINIENSYFNKNINTQKIFEKGFSEKSNHLGLGLWEVNIILKRNNNIKLITSKDENYFKQHLEIYY